MTKCALKYEHLVTCNKTFFFFASSCTTGCSGQDSHYTVIVFRKTVGNLVEKNVQMKRKWN